MQYCCILEWIKLTLTHHPKMTSEKKIMSKAQGLIKGLVVISLIFLYVLGTVDLEFFHHFVHKHEAAELHTAQQESDPCHVTLHHPERGADCGHKAHFVNEDKCPLCHAQVTNTPVVETCSIVLAPAFNVALYHNILEQRTGGTIFQSTGRAPPVS